MKKNNKDILQLILKDHEALKDSIAVLLSEKSLPSEKKNQLQRFLYNLNVHSKSEEASLYDSLINLSKIRPNILESYEEHNLADHLVFEIQMRSSFDSWDDELEAKVKILVEIIANHLEEEENILFPEVKSYLTQLELENLGVVYQQKRKEQRQKFDSVSWAVQNNIKGTVFKVSSFVSHKLSDSR